MLRMKKKRLPLAMLAALADKSGMAHPVILETPETLIYPFYPLSETVSPDTREPYHPNKADWSEIYSMLCGCCAHELKCEIVEDMIEMKNGGQWPEGGWTTDPGAGVTCLSYQPKPMVKLSEPELKKAMADAVPMCSGCAAQKGSEASVSLHTRRDFRAAVNAPALFRCHADGQQGKPCGGWCQAVKARQ